MTSPRSLRSMAEVELAIGETLGPSDWRTIDQDTIDGFADVTGDHQWIHVDTERAAASPFGSTIAHGYLTLAMLPRFGQDVFAFETGTARLNYGVETARFPAPVPVGSRVRATATIVEVRRVTAGSQVFVAWNVEAEGVTKPVCVARTITLIVD